jgi:hypothetical protein
MRPNWLGSLALTALMLALMIPAAPALAAPDAPLYIPETELTIRGTVAAVLTEGSRKGIAGVQVTLSTDSGPITVYLAPTKFLVEKNLTVAAGDLIQVSGSKTVFYDDETVVLARTVRKGDTYVVLRDDRGTPKW